jgi:4,4'-diaponeurosporenoate glycosyltransferase
VIATLVFGAGLLAGGLAMARPRYLPPASSDELHPAPAISVVIPARNAATTIAPLLASCARFGTRAMEVIVVDDASHDATGELAAAYGAIVLRLDGDPPNGWTGKAYACHRGAALATAPVLLFLDADVTIRAGALDRLLAAHAAHGGLLSVQPFHRTQRPYEVLSAMCNVVAIMGSGAFAPWRSIRKPAAFGPCLLMSSSDYTEVGGHAGVRGEVVEDVALARRFHSRGLPVTVFTGWGAVEFRMYPDGPRQLANGWTKNLASGAKLVDPVASAIAVWWVSACIAFTAMAVRVAAVGAPHSIVLALVCWTIVAAQLRWMWRRVGSFGWFAALLHPIATGAFVALFVRSAWATFVRRRVRWSGRPIALTGRSS